ncbi:MAG TPA: hypothetical protein DEP45_01020 [Armatimonadetes bacterium]|nr:hypothetical protein [Armatimonadota bacterium]
MAAETQEIAENEEPRPGWWPMIGVHIGLMIVIIGAIYTPQIEIRGMVPSLEWARYLLVGIAVVIVGLVPALDVRSAAARALLALGGAVALYLACMPQLDSLPGGAAIVGTPFAMLGPSVAHTGVVIAAIFLGLQAVVDRRALPRRVPFVSSVLVAGGLLLALMAIMWLSLRGVYDLSMTTSPLLLVFRTVMYGLLMLVCLTIPGVRGVGRSAHIYIGLALLAAVVRNLATAGGM